MNDMFHRSQPLRTDETVLHGDIGRVASTPEGKHTTYTWESGHMCAFAFILGGCTLGKLVEYVQSCNYQYIHTHVIIGLECVYTCAVELIHVCPRCVFSSSDSHACTLYMYQCVQDWQSAYHST